MAFTGVRNDINQLIERMFTMVQQQLPTGFRDDIGIVAERKDDVSQYVLGLCRNRQYTKISTPLVEYNDVFNGYAMGRGQHMYEFMDSSEVSVVIRPDLTLPIGRFLATTNIELPRTFYYLGDVFMKNKKHREEQKYLQKMYRNSRKNSFFHR